MCPGKHKIMKFKKGPKVNYAKFYLKLFCITRCIVHAKEWLINCSFLFPVFFTEIYVKYHEVSNFYKF